MREIGDVVDVQDKFQTGYSYRISCAYGDVANDKFSPEYAPGEMLAMGVFEGKYINDCENEFPADWYMNARLSDWPDPEINYFGIKSRQPLSV